MKKNLKGGFTLIELLVVIAIIGILASVVLASLNTARNKGADAATKAQLANARAQAELYYDTQSPNSYASVCSGSGGIGTLWAAANNSSGGTAACNSNNANWYLGAPLKAGTTNANFWCVDSAGTSRAQANNGVAANFSCS
jgi:prepilin-type N-terminal cleavage/methylation domain-containing protein